MNDKNKLLEELEEVKNQLTDNQEKQDVIEDLRDDLEVIENDIYDAILEAKSALEKLRDGIEAAISFNDNYKHELKEIDTVNLTDDLEQASKQATALLSQIERVNDNDIDTLQAALSMIQDAASDYRYELEGEAEDLTADLEKVEAAIEEGGE